MKKIFALLLCLLCVFAFAGCEQPDPPKNTDWETVTQPTCTTEGLKQRYVDDVLQEETIPALGHDFGEWIVVEQATCTADGVEQKKCSRCPEVQEQTIEAHHVLKDNPVFDIDNHYYECENCTEKFDSEGHQFSTSRELKYAYYMEWNSKTSYVDKLCVGYVDTITCNHCDVIIKDVQLISKYYWGDISNTAFSRQTDAGIPTEKYDIALGFGISNRGRTFNFTYDSNYNLVEMSDKWNTVQYFYTYENGEVSQIEITNTNSFAVSDGSRYKHPTIYLTLSREDGLLTITNEQDGNVVSTCIIDGNVAEINSIIYYMMDTGVLEIHYGGYTDEIYTYDEQGYITYYEYWKYDSNDQLSEHFKEEYERTYDNNGNISTCTVTKTTNAYTQVQENSFEYDENNHIVAIDTIYSVYFEENYGNDYTSTADTLKLEYDGDQLISWWIESTSGVKKDVYTYHYDENSVQAYDENNELVLEIEYISEYKLAE